MHNIWYTNNKKHVPTNIEEFLSPICLAIWTIDDGSRVGNGIKWCTNCFSFEDCIKLSNSLYNIYGLKTSVQSSGKHNQYHIYVFKESIPNLRNIVKPFIVNSILYKLGI